MSCPFTMGEPEPIPARSFSPTAVVFGVSARPLSYRWLHARRQHCRLPRRFVVGLIRFSASPVSSSPASLHRGSLSQVPLEEEVVRGANGIVTPAEQPHRRPFRHRSCSFVVSIAALGPPSPAPPRERYRAGEKLVVDV